MTKETYNWAVDTLLDAYNKGELFHGDCSACAVGNLCGGNGSWNLYIKTTASGEATSPEDWVLCLNAKRFNKPMPITPFTNEELESIEQAFEMALHNSKEGYKFWVKPENRKQGQYMGLVAVLKVLKEMLQAQPQELSTVFVNSKGELSPMQRLNEIATGFDVFDLVEREDG